MINTSRLELKPMSLDDASFQLEIMNTKEYIENIGQRNIDSIEKAEDYIQEKMIKHYEQHGYGNYLIQRKEDKVKVGCVSLYNRPDVEGVDIGFAMLPAYCRKGYGNEAAKALMQYAQYELKLPAVCAFTTAENLPSQKLIKKLGLVFKNTILFGEEKEELLYFELLF